MLGLLSVFFSIFWKLCIIYNFFGKFYQKPFSGSCFLNSIKDAVTNFVTASYLKLPDCGIICKCNLEATL